MSTLPPDSTPPWPPPAPPAPPYQPPASSGKATASLVLGICGVVLCPLVCSVLAIVFAVQARREIEASQGTIGGGGLATAGLVLGWIGIALVVLMIVAFVALFAATEQGFDVETSVSWHGRALAIVAGGALAGTA